MINQSIFRLVIHVDFRVMEHLDAWKTSEPTKKIVPFIFVFLDHILILDPILVQSQPITMLQYLFPLELSFFWDFAFTLAAKEVKNL